MLTAGARGAAGAQLDLRQRDGQTGLDLECGHESEMITSAALATAQLPATMTVRVDEAAATAEES